MLLLQKLKDLGVYESINFCCKTILVFGVVFVGFFRHTKNANQTHFPSHPTFESVSMWCVVSDRENPSSSRAFPVLRQIDWYQHGSSVLAIQLAFTKESLCVNLLAVSICVPVKLMKINKKKPKPQQQKNKPHNTRYTNSGFLCSCRQLCEDFFLFFSPVLYFLKSKKINILSP